jgi:shikimate kinase
MDNLLKGINVFLIGMMGSGKSTVGQILAQKLNYRFLDTDVLIEKVANQTINDIFTNQGEATFRDLETQVLAGVSSYTRSAIATGGGIILRTKNWSYLHHGLIVWLDTSVEVLIERLATDDTRPLLKYTNPAQKLHSLLEERRSLYAQADLHIVTGSETPEDIAHRIIKQIPTILKQKTLPETQQLEI